MVVGSYTIEHNSIMRTMKSMTSDIHVSYIAQYKDIIRLEE